MQLMGYQLFDPVTEEVIISRNVTFDKVNQIEGLMEISRLTTFR